MWDATNIRRDQRNAIIQLGLDYQALVTLVVFHVSEAELWARNEARANPIPTACQVILNSLKEEAFSGSCYARYECCLHSILQIRRPLHHLICKGCQS